ncbi:MAG TPA: hypothetical protein VFS16_18780, partial [Acidimicrobiia bacterium]|nr:hypothetical protein [Acidimicrobiia bacterium]
MGYQGKPRRIRRAAALAVVMAVSSSMAANALDAGSLLSPILSPVTGGAKAGVAPFGAAGGGYAAFATGTVLHAGVAGTVGAMVDLVSSTAAATSAPTASATNSELGRVALPALPARGSYGQGLGLGVGVGLLPGVSAGLMGHAVATAPPSSAPVESQAAPVGVAPLLHLTPLRARAQALSSAAACVLGSNLASGQSNAADVSLTGLTALKGLSVGDPGAGSALSRSESRTAIVPGSTPGRLGLMSETVQVLGPVTLLAGTANQTTVELKGQWMLRVTADGRTSSVSYSPQNLPADQNAVLVRDAAGAVVASASAAQMKLAGTVGVRLDIPGVGELVVGEQPRARGRSGAPQNSGTSAEAAVDLVRIRLLGQDVRLGHMEAAVAVPAAGVTCPGLEVSITPDTPTVTPGTDFSAKVRVRNPNEGTVSGLTIASRMAADPGVTVHGGPASRDNVVAPNGAAFKLTTPLAAGQSVELPARVHVDPTSGPGRVRLGASATGRYGDGSLAVPAAGDGVTEGVAISGPAVAAGNVSKDPVQGKAPATVSAPSKTGSGGRKPARVSAGVSGAAGSAASAAPVTPAPTTPTTAATVPAPPPVDPPAVDPTPPAPAPEAAPAPPGKEETAAPGRSSTDSDRRRYGWAGAAAVLAVAVAAAGAR